MTAPSVAGALGLLAVAALGWGCNGASGSTDDESPPSRGDVAPRPELRGERQPPGARARRLPPCPPESGNCSRAGGRVIYVEAVDPDGGGDAHVVLASRQGITTRGVTVVDIEPKVRPERLPRPGDWVGAAGPVFRGSHGQRQIEATELTVARRGRGSGP